MGGALKLRSHKSLTVLAVVVGVGLVGTAAAWACSGGGGGAAFQTTPANSSTLTFSSGVGQKLTVVIDNTGSTVLTVGTEVINPGSKFGWVKSCSGVNINPGSSCTDEIECLQKGEGEFATSVSGVGMSNIKLKCD